MPKKYDYRISVVRYGDEQYEKMNDKILVEVAHSKKEACNVFERLLTEAGFEHIERRMKSLRSRNWTPMTSHCSFNRNLHGYLGPGGYIIEKVEVKPK